MDTLHTAFPVYNNIRKTVEMSITFRPNLVFNLAIKQDSLYVSSFILVSEILVELLFLSLFFFKQVGSFLLN